MEFATSSRRGLSGSALKLIAIIAMALDHIAWCLIDPQITSICPITFPHLAPLTMMRTLPLLYILSYLFHFIGRITFPLMLLFLTEGLTHTRNVRRYALNLLIFAFISEIPFDLAFSGMAFDFSSQNAFFTLFLSLIAIYAIRKLPHKPLLTFLAVALCAIASELLHSDYGFKGIIIICVMELLHERKTHAYLFGCLAATALSPCETTALLALPAVHVYNGQRGRKRKYFFYIFYPAHLLLLFFIKRLLF